MHYERHREHQPAAAQDHQDSGHFPTDEAATKLVWLALRNITTDWGVLFMIGRRLWAGSPSSTRIDSFDHPYESQLASNTEIFAPIESAASQAPVSNDYP
ncbi:transposase mutator family protein [Burkholderia latens]|uniref:Transposase mutator family protein n=1 Tax=Burkholderia latens TaxID=488446 RepID=A0A6P2H7U0_9BURK|nr:transposase mutator family protein [Burkholderia latens]